MIGPVLSQVVPWLIRRLRFDGQVGADTEARTRAAFEAFLCGARPAMVRAGRDAVVAAEGSVDWQMRSFFWEGQSFGAAARHALSLRGGNTRGSYFADGYPFMFYTGLGVWNGLAPRYPLPRVSLAAERWADVDDFVGFRQFIAGGSSFAAAVLAERVEPSLIDALDPGTDVYWRRGLMQGAGRAAWFLHMHDLPRLAAMLDDFSEVGFAEGLGVAITFTQLDRPDVLLDTLHQLPASALPHLRAGTRAALGAIGEDPRSVGRLRSLPEPLPRWFSEGAAVLRAAGRGPDMPELMAAGLDALDV